MTIPAPVLWPLIRCSKQAPQRYCCRRIHELPPPPQRYPRVPGRMRRVPLQHQRRGVESNVSPRSQRIWSRPLYSACSRARWHWVPTGVCKVPETLMYSTAWYFMYILTPYALQCVAGPKAGFRGANFSALPTGAKIPRPRIPELWETGVAARRQNRDSAEAGV